MHRQQGFTLVEVITVMLVLVAIASITVESSKDFVFQNRYDITKDRYEKIKKAIIGDPNQVINGQPNIEGFVKDVGRLPFNLHELTDGYCSDNTGYKDKANCIGILIWTDKTFLSSKEVLKDGWGNDWNYDASNRITVKLYSVGKNGSTVNNEIEYDKDYPSTDNIAIIESDWKVDISQLRFLIKSNNNSGTSKDIKSKINNSSVTGNASIIEDGTQRLISFDYGMAKMIPLGNVTVGIYNNDLITKYPFNNPDITITLAPNTTLPTINW